MGYPLRTAHHRVRVARADRRVLVHPRRARHRVRADAARGPHLILAGALISITLNPFAFVAADRSTAWHRRRPRSRRGSRTRTQRAARAPSRPTSTRARRRAPTRARRAQDALARGARRRTSRCSRPDARAARGRAAAPSSRTRAQPGERVIHRGDKADAVYFISTGQVEVAVGRPAHPARARRLLRRDGADQRAAALGRRHRARLHASSSSSRPTTSTRSCAATPTSRRRSSRRRQQRDAMNRRQAEQAVVEARDTPGRGAGHADVPRP